MQRIVSRVSRLSLSTALSAVAVALGLTMLQNGVEASLRVLHDRRVATATRAIVSPIRFGTAMEVSLHRHAAADQAPRGYLWVHWPRASMSAVAHRDICAALADTVSLQRLRIRVLLVDSVPSRAPCSLSPASGFAAVSDSTPLFGASSEAAWAILDSRGRVLYSAHTDVARSTTRSLAEILAHLLCSPSSHCEA